MHSKPRYTNLPMYNISKREYKVALNISHKYCSGLCIEGLAAYLYGEWFEAFSEHKIFKYIFTQHDLNMRQMRWMEYMKQYNSDLQHHSEKANTVADALSHETQGTMLYLISDD